MTPAIRAYLRQIGARGNQAMRGTQIAKERVRKADLARWAEYNKEFYTKVFPKKENNK